MLEFQLDKLKDFFEQVQPLFSQLGVENICFYSVFDDMDGAYFLTANYLKNNENKEVDLDNLLDKSITNTHTKIVGHLIYTQNNGREFTLTPLSNFSDFLKQIPDQEYYRLNLAQTIEKELPQKSSSFKKHKI